MFTAWVRYWLFHNKEISQTNKTQSSISCSKTVVQIYPKVKASAQIRLGNREQKLSNKGTNNNPQHNKPVQT